VLAGRAYLQALAVCLVADHLKAAGDMARDGDFFTADVAGEDAPGERAGGATEGADAPLDVAVYVRVTGDTIIVSPPLVVSNDQIGEITDKIRTVIQAVA
jgi:adenosylmethionine-8-amino-7-oxononanoate aminotransferase